MEITKVENITPYQDVNTLLALLSKNLAEILDGQLVGLYLTGSLTSGDFDRGSSDIDFLLVLTHPLSAKQLKQIKNMHSRIGKDFPVWEKRIEGSYITKNMLSSTKPPKESRPYVNAGKMWNLVYGNEWILNLHVLYECGIALLGPDPKELIGSVNLDAVREASKRNLIQEWQPKLKDPSAFRSDDYDSNHLQAYAVLTMCRILYLAKNDGVASKRVASTWAKKTYGRPWSDLVKKAEDWQHGKEMNAEEQTKDFIKFTVKEVG
jgi:predicted nucleotidyltransferase